MTKLVGVVKQLKAEHDRLMKQIRGVSAALSAFGAAYGKGTGTRRRISTAGRARIAAAQRARWAKLRGESGPKKAAVQMPKRRTMSVAARKKIAAAQRLRWKKQKAANAA
jgi:hypothetical protein